jgi:hypothetical protein
MSARPKSKRATDDLEEFTLEYPYTTFEGERRSAVVAVDAIKDTGVWSVYDMPAGRGAAVGWLVERLAGYDEKLDAAIGLARTYCESQVAFHSNERGGHSSPDPLPNPAEIPIKEIRKHVALAKRLVAAMNEPQAVAA